MSCIRLFALTVKSGDVPVGRSWNVQVAAESVDRQRAPFRKSGPRAHCSVPLAMKESAVVAQIIVESAGLTMTFEIDCPSNANPVNVDWLPVKSVHVSPPFVDFRMPVP